MKYRYALRGGSNEGGVERCRRTSSLSRARGSRTFGSPRCTKRRNQWTRLPGCRAGGRGRGECTRRDDRWTADFPLHVPAGWRMQRPSPQALTHAPTRHQTRPRPYISMDRWTQRFTCRLYDFFSSSSREKCNVAACHDVAVCSAHRIRWDSSRGAARSARAAGGPPRR